MAQGTVFQIYSNQLVGIIAISIATLVSRTNAGDYSKLQTAVGWRAERLLLAESRRNEPPSFRSLHSLVALRFSFPSDQQNAEVSPASRFSEIVSVTRIHNARARVSRDQTKGLTTVRRPSMTWPCCMSSEYSVSQSVWRAAATTSASQWLSP